MALTAQEEITLENLKQEHKKELLTLQSADREAEHKQKMERLVELKAIAQLGGRLNIGE